MPTERLLVVDDDPAILDLCFRILQADGYFVVGAKRGEDALARLEAELFDLLLTDIRLPGLNGLEVTRRLRERGLELSVVTMTGYSNMEMAIQALSLGVDEFLVKPFTLDSLRLTISRALEKSRLRREIMRLSTLVPLLQASQESSLARTRASFYERMCAAVQLLFKTAQVAFLEIGGDGRVLTVAAVYGSALESLRDGVFLTSQFDRADELLETSTTAWSEHDTPRLPVALPDVNWLVAAPFTTRDKPLGLVLAAVSVSPSAGDLEALRLLCSHAASALENVDLFRDLGHALFTARQAERLKGEFINIAGHELQTPLTVLADYAELLRSRLSGDLGEYAAHVVEQAERLQHIADDMLKLESLNSGHVELRLERCEVAQAVRRVVNAYRPRALERGQSIESELDENAGFIVADRAMLDVILGSLISNAIKFSPRNTRVRVAAQGDAFQVTLRVEDQGIGLSAEQAAHVFDAFYQASPSLTREKESSSFGLALTRHMVNAHGGKIWIEPALGSGTCFLISLPRQACPEPLPPPAQNF